MKKLILCAFIALSTLTSCSNDDSEPAKVDNSFSYKITALKGVNDAGEYVDISTSKNVDANSKIVYDKSAKTITISVGASNDIIKDISVNDSTYDGLFKVPTSDKETYTKANLELKNDVALLSITNLNLVGSVSKYAFFISK
ncbi:hypothetical protein [Flavobacterium daemonense]|uniref:hypothetical protein n=1 Tax=Flavobacterium daemonense TaxID=1393049 RepID=UPI00118620FA|nr:hypothetical protein [Flavobacterium daemonense]KAF2337229.1 hypothetical protein FND99_02110 [Flavobacterium daemonense]